MSIYIEIHNFLMGNLIVSITCTYFALILLTRYRKKRLDLSVFSNDLGYVSSYQAYLTHTFKHHIC